MLKKSIGERRLSPSYFSSKLIICWTAYYCCWLTFVSSLTASTSNLADFIFCTNFMCWRRSLALIMPERSLSRSSNSITKSGVLLMSISLQNIVDINWSSLNSIGSCAAFLARSLILLKNVGCVSWNPSLNKRIFNSRTSIFPVWATYKSHQAVISADLQSFNSWNTFLN